MASWVYRRPHDAAAHRPRAKVAALVTAEILGTLTATESNDTLVATAMVELKGTLTATEADDTLTATGIVGATPIEGTLTATEADDTLDADATVLVTGTLEATEDDDTLVAEGIVLITGTLDATEADDTLDAVASVVTVPPPGGLTLDAPSRPAESIAWLFDVGGFHLATRDLVLSGTSYFRAIVRGPTVDRRLDQVFYGFQELSRVTVEVTNPTGALDALWTTEQRGASVTLRRHDWLRSVTVTEFTGVVEQVELEAGRILIRCVNLDLSVLETMVPRTIITTAVYGASCPDVGKAEQKIIGTCAKVPLPYVKDDVPGAQFWYFASVGTGYTIPAVYRDRSGQFTGQYQQLNPSEYVVSTSLVSGRTIIRTLIRQLNGASGGSFHRLFADIVGPSSERNFARAIRNLYSDTTWGLGETVDSTNFNDAEAALPVNLLCDGVLHEQRPAREWLKPLLVVRGMRPGFGAAGWRLAVDTVALTAKMAVRDGAGVGERTMLRSGTRTRPALDEQVSVYKLRGGLDYVTGEYTLPAADRTVAAIGLEKIEENEFLRDRTSLDMTACYRAKRHEFNGMLRDAEVNEEGRTLNEGDAILATNPLLLLQDHPMKVIALTKGSGRQRLVAVDYDPDLYVYDALALPTVPAIDQTVTPPSITSLSLPTWTGAGLGTDGTATIDAAFTIVVPATPNIQYTRLDWKLAGAAEYQRGGPISGSGSLAARVNGLIPGRLYDFQALTVAGMNESTAMFRLAQLAPGDTTAPGTPGTPTIQAQHLREFTFQVTAPSDSDIRDLQWDVRTSSGGGGSLVMEGTAPTVPGATSTIKVTLPASVPYNSARFFRVRAKDLTGNPTSPTAGWSAAVSFTAAQVVSGDVGNDAIQTIHIINSAITSGKIAINAVTQSLATTAGAVSLSSSFGTIASLGITTQGGLLRIEGQSLLQYVSSGASGAIIEMRLRNTTTGAFSPSAGLLAQPSIGPNGVTVVCLLQESPSAGSYTYALEARSLIATTTSPQASATALRITEYKR